MEPTEKPVTNTTIVMNQGDSAANLTHAPQIRLETPASNVKKAKKDVREAKAYQGQMKEFREIYNEVLKRNFKPPASGILSQDESLSYEFDRRAFYLQKFNEAVAAKEREKEEELSQQEPITEEHNEGPGTENDAGQSGLDLEPELIGTLMSLGCSPEKAQELAALRGKIKRETEKANSQASIQDGVIPQEKAQHIENLLDRMRQAANERLKQLKSARHGS